MDRSRLLVIFAMALSFVSVFLGIANIGIASGESEFQGPASYFLTSGKSGVAVIPVEGLINARGGPSQRVSILKKHIQDARQASSIRAVILRIDSPGGGSASIKELYDAVRETRKIKPVFAVIGDRATGGGYYIASAADQIYARQSSVIGGMQTVLLRGDFLSSLRGRGASASSSGQVAWGVQLAEQDAGKTDDTDLKDLLQDAREAFVTDVSEGREESIKRVRTWMGATLYSGKRAKAEQWIDEVGGMDEALAGIKLQLKTSRELPLFTLKEESFKGSLMTYFQSNASLNDSPCMHLPGPVLYMHTADPALSILAHRCATGTGKGSD